MASLGAGAALAAWSARWLLRSPRVPLRANHRGDLVPLALGRALAESAVLATVVGALLARRNLTGDRMTINALVAVLVLYLAGAWDDRAVSPERGFREHLGGLFRGRITTGVVKMLAGILASVAVALAAGGGPLRVVSATVLIAASTNLWNALDVKPGRALKWSLVALVPILVRSWTAPFAFLGCAMFGAAAVLLVPDLRERGMLGDAGSNPLGFVVGVGVAVVLSTPWLLAAAGAMLALTIVAETITLSRLIDATGPLRWFDALGRKPDDAS